MDRNTEYEEFVKQHKNKVENFYKDTISGYGIIFLQSSCVSGSGYG